MSTVQPRAFEFGPYRLEVAERRLLRGADPIPLTPKAFDTLAILVARSGHLVTKEALLREVWPDAHVEENNLVQNISLLRRTLRDGADGTAYIETVPKIGYRFVAAVRELPRPVAVSPPVEPTRAPLPPRSERRPWPWIVPAAVAATIVGASYLVYSSWARTAVAAVKTPAARTLAVLPLRNLKPDRDTDFLGLALTDAIINRLGSVSELVVRPTATVLKYRNSEADPRQIARDLNVETVLTGSYVKDGEDLRITTELIKVDAAEGPLRQNIELKYERLISVQDRVATGVVHGMGLVLRPEEVGITDRGLPTNPLAYEYYLRAADLSFSSNFEGAVRLGEKVVELEPGNAMAWCTLADNYIGYANNQGGGKAYADKGWEAFRKARALDPGNQVIAGLMAFQLIENNRMEEAMPVLRDLLHRNPNDSWAHWYLSEAYRYGGALEQSEREGETARKLNSDIPENTTLNTYLYLGEYDKFLGSLPSEENARVSFYRGLAHVYLGDTDRALVEFDHASALNPALLHAQIGAALADALRGRQQAGLALMKQVERTQTEDGEMVYKMAQACAQLRDAPSALRLLRRSIELNFYPYPYFAADPLLDPIRTEPEFGAILALARQRQDAFERKYF